MRPLIVVSALTAIATALAPAARAGAGNPCVVVVDPPRDQYSATTMIGGPIVWDEVGNDIRSVTVSATEDEFVVEVAFEPAEPAPGSALIERDVIVLWLMGDETDRGVYAADTNAGASFRFYDGQAFHQVGGAWNENRTHLAVHVPLAIATGIGPGQLMYRFHAAAGSGPSVPGTYHYAWQLPTAQYDSAPNPPEEAWDARSDLEDTCFTGGSES